MNESKAAMVNIGQSKETITAVGSVIMAVLKSNAEQETKRVALVTLQQLTKVENIAFTGCSFTAK